jgi:hypothetical protein
MPLADASDGRDLRADMTVPSVLSMILQKETREMDVRMKTLEVVQAR